MFEKVNGFIRDYDGTKYLVLFDSEKYDAIYDRIRYLTDFKSNIIYVFSHNQAKIKIDSDDDLPQEKTLILHNAIIFIKSNFNENQNHNTIKYSQKNFQISLMTTNIVNDDDDDDDLLLWYG